MTATVITTINSNDFKHVVAIFIFDVIGIFQII